MNNATNAFRILLDYRKELIDLSKPSLGPFEPVFGNLLEHEDFKRVIASKTKIENEDSFLTNFVFNYVITFPLLEVYIKLVSFTCPDFVPYVENKINPLSDIDVSAFTEDELKYYPDIFHDVMISMPDDTPEEVREVAHRAWCFSKNLANPPVANTESEWLDDFMEGYRAIGKAIAIECIKYHEHYRSFEWEIIEGILRSPYFPDFFEECERAAGTPEIPYKYRNWPEREFFLQDAEKGKGVANYFILRSEVLNDFKTEEGYPHFRDFMDYLAKCGGISCDAYMESLLQLFTGFRFEEASRVVKWNGKNVRVLFYVLKYISKEKGRYQKLQPGHGVIFPEISGTDEGFFLGESADPGNRLQDGKGIPDNVLESLHNYYDFFPALGENQS